LPLAALLSALMLATLLSAALLSATLTARLLLLLTGLLLAALLAAALLAALLPALVLVHIGHEKLLLSRMIPRLRQPPAKAMVPVPHAARGRRETPRLQ
jgi:hypothetical protein